MLRATRRILMWEGVVMKPGTMQCDGWSCRAPLIGMAGKTANSRRPLPDNGGYGAPSCYYGNEYGDGAWSSYDARNWSGGKDKYWYYIWFWVILICHSGLSRDENVVKYRQGADGRSVLASGWTNDRNPSWLGLKVFCLWPTGYMTRDRPWYSPIPLIGAISQSMCQWQGVLFPIPFFFPTTLHQGYWIPGPTLVNNRVMGEHSLYAPWHPARKTFWAFLDMRYGPTESRSGFGTHPPGHH